MRIAGRIGMMMLVWVAMTACQDDTRPLAPSNNTAADAGDAGDTSEDATGDTANDDATTPDTGDPPRCTGSGECAPSCGGDWFGGSTCVDGRWVCDEPGWILVDDCPPGSCFGLPLEGEECGPNGWECSITPESDLGGESCGPTRDMCFGCSGWDEAAVGDACGCVCTPNQTVACGDSVCQAEVQTDLPGVSLRVGPAPCGWSLDRLAEGVEIPYEVTVEAPITVVDQGTNAGGCGTNSPSGLFVFGRIDGDGDTRYCPECDTGLCGGSGQPQTIEPGTYPGVFTWAGRVWDGPSDTGMEPGRPFDAGVYRFSLSATGAWVDDDGAATPYTLGATMEVHVWETP